LSEGEGSSQAEASLKTKPPGLVGQLISCPSGPGRAQSVKVEAQRARPWTETEGSVIHFKNLSERRASKESEKPRFTIGWGIGAAKSRNYKDPLIEGLLKFKYSRALSCCNGGLCR